MIGFPGYSWARKEAQLRAEIEQQMLEIETYGELIGLGRLLHLLDHEPSAARIRDLGPQRPLKVVK